MNNRNYSTIFSNIPINCSARRDFNDKRMYKKNTSMIASIERYTKRRKIYACNKSNIQLHDKLFRWSLFMSRRFTSVDLRIEITFKNDWLHQESIEKCVQFFTNNDLLWSCQIFRKSFHSKGWEDECHIQNELLTKQG